MMRCAQDLGARFRMGEAVGKILIEGGRAKGIEFGSGERLPADAVVVNADLPYAATRLIPPEARG